MLRYMAAAFALKAFSANSWTMGAYRALGNRFGGPLARRDSYMNSHIKRSKLFIDLCEKYDVLQDGDKLLEIGTGWIHWHSLYHRLFYDVHVSMLDVWDCRQFDALQTMFGEVRQKLTQDSSVRPVVRERLDAILDAKNFDELYRKFDLTYVVNPAGSLAQFDDNSMDCVFSFHVLEHVPRENTSELAKNVERVLKPGGYSIHQIGIDDHLTHYDKNASPKNYLRYSDRAWKWFFQNDIQYINRIQMSEWLSLFKENGLISTETVPYYCDIKGLRPNRRFAGYSRQDLECTILTIIHRKPPT